MWTVQLLLSLLLAVQLLLCTLEIYILSAVRHSLAGIMAQGDAGRHVWPAT